MSTPLAQRSSFYPNPFSKAHWVHPANAKNKPDFMSAYSGREPVTHATLEITQDMYKKACWDLFRVQCTLDQSKPRSSS
jgi:hypothetical protein